MPVETDQMTMAWAPALRARSISGVMSGWVASMFALTTTSAPSLARAAAEALAALTP